MLAKYGGHLLLRIFIENEMCLSLTKHSCVHDDSAIILKGGQVFTVAPWTTGQDKRPIS